MASDAGKGDKKTRSTSKDLVASMDKRVEDIETHVDGFKNEIEELKAELDMFKAHTNDSLQQIEPLGNEFLELRNDFKLAIALMREELKHELKEEFKKELGQVQDKIEEKFNQLQTELNVCKRALANGSDNIISTSPKNDVPKPTPFVGKREARAVDEFLWEIEQYFDAVDIVDDTKKIKMVTLYLKETAALWWRRKHMEIEKGMCAITTWADFVKEIKKQFYPENSEHEAKIRLRNLKQKGTIKDYINDFTTLVLEIPDLSPKDSLIYFVDGLQSWAKTELERRNVQDLSSAIAAAENLFDHSERRSTFKPTNVGTSDEKVGGAKPIINNQFRNDNNQYRKDDNRRPTRYFGRDQNANKGCFLCDGPHDARDCPKKSKLTALIRTDDEETNESEEARLGAMQLQVLNALSKMEGKPLMMANQTNPTKVVGNTKTGSNRLRFVNIEIRGQLAKALVDTGATHNFISPNEARRLGLRITTQAGMIKAAVGKTTPIEGMAWGVKTKIGTWTGKLHFTVVPLDDYDIVLGMEFFRRANAAPATFINTLYIVKGNQIHTATLEPDTRQRGKTVSTLKLIKPNRRLFKKHDEDVVDLGGGECHEPPKNQVATSSFRNFQGRSRHYKSCWNSLEFATQF